MSPAATPVAGTTEIEVAKLVADILAEEMGLDQKHCLLGDQAWNIPPDRALFLVVFAQVAAPFGGTDYLDTDPASSTVGKEVQQAAAMHDVRIEMMSYDPSARVRQMEPGLALASLFSQQMQERYGMQVGRAQQPVNASDTEVTGCLQKFVIHANVTALHQKVKDPPARGDYFDKFNMRPGFTTDAVNPPQIAVEE